MVRPSLRRLLGLLGLLPTWSLLPPPAPPVPPALMSVPPSPGSFTPGSFTPGSFTAAASASLHARRPTWRSRLIASARACGCEAARLNPRLEVRAARPEIHPDSVRCQALAKAKRLVSRGCACKRMRSSAASVGAPITRASAKARASEQLRSTAARQLALAASSAGDVSATAHLAHASRREMAACVSSNVDAPAGGRCVACESMDKRRAAAATSARLAASASSAGMALSAPCCTRRARDFSDTGAIGSMSGDSLIALSSARSARTTECSSPAAASCAAASISLINASRMGFICAVARNGKVCSTASRRCASETSPT